MTLLASNSPLGRGFLTGQIKKPSDFEGTSLLLADTLGLLIRPFLQREISVATTLVSKKTCVLAKSGTVEVAN